MYATGPGGRGSGNPNVQQMLQSAGGMPMVNASSRVPEMLDNVKVEFESLLQQLGIIKMERDEFERKIQSQLQEMEQIQQSLKALESNHRRIRQHYEEDIMRMRRQLEGVQGQGQGSTSGAGAMPTAAPRSVKRGRPPVDDNAHLTSQSSRGTPVQMSAPSGGSAGAPGSATLMPALSQQQALPPSSSSMQTLRPVAPQPPAAPPEQQTVSRPPTSEMMMNRVAVNQQLQSYPAAASLDSAKGSTEGVVIVRPEQSSGPMNLQPTSTAAAPPPLKKSKTEVGEGSSMSMSSGGNGVNVAPAGSEEANKERREGSTTAPEETDSNEVSSNGSKAKVKWTIQYNSKSSSYPETERPHVEMKHTLDHQSVVCCVRFSADGSRVASGCHKTAQVFDVQTGQQAFSVSRPTEGNGEGEDAYVRAVCFSPDGTRLVAGMPQNTIRVWDIATQKEGLSFSGHDSEIYSLDFVKNLIASGSGDRTVRLWDDRDGSCHAVFGNEQGGPKDGVTSVALSSDGRLLAAASLDKVVRIWDTNTTQLVDRLEGHNDSVYSIAFSPDGKNIISGSLDRTLMLWDVSASGRTTTRPRLLFQGHKDFVLSVAYTPDGRWLMSGSKDRTVLFWDPRSTRSVLTLSGYRNSVISVASSPASPHFATGSGDCFACVWKYQCQTI